MWTLKKYWPPQRNMIYLLNSNAEDRPGCGSHGYRSGRLYQTG
jgi:hypothetical protein